MSAAPPGRQSLSVCVITRDEEDRIGDCLASVAWADERIVVDSGSTDRTAAVAREHGARVIERPWPGYPAQKNFALGEAVSDWVLSLDADERVSPELADELRAFLAAPPAGVVAASVPRLTRYLGRWIRRGGWYPDRKVRLARRGAARWEGGDLHERLVPDGPTARLRGDLLHHTYRDVADHLRRIDRYSTEAARGLHARGTGRAAAAAGLVLKPPAKFLAMYVLKGGFLEGMPGFIVAALGGYYVFLRYAKLWELHQRR